MDDNKLYKVLEEVRNGSLDIKAAMDLLSGWPSDKINFAELDHQRCKRTNIPEVIYGENKDSLQIIEIARRMLKHSYAVMATRVSSEKAELVCRELPELNYNQDARMLYGNIENFSEDKGRGVVAVICAGTSDIPVAEEVNQTVICLGQKTETAYDVGIAGLHRLISRKELLKKASVIVVAAGMEGALPSVVAGLVSAPVIAVPTSVGYGTGMGGFAALIAMLNSCAPGVAVVNIDNGFGAGCMAASINKKQ